MTKSSQIIFLRVTNPQAKVRRICLAVQDHFSKGDRILVRAHNETSTKFLDELLWRFPRDSFLPHEVCYSPTKEPIVITTVDRNINDAAILIHLCPMSSTMADRFSRVYDLQDETSAAKYAQAERRYAAYQQQGYPLLLR